MVAGPAGCHVARDSSELIQGRDDNVTCSLQCHVRRGYGIRWLGESVADRVEIQHELVRVCFGSSVGSPAFLLGFVILGSDHDRLLFDVDWQDFGR
jgi:hypothetical protein